VVLRPGTSTTASEIRAYCREHFAPYKVPAIVELCHALPKTLLVGKIVRRKVGAAQETPPEGATADVRERTSA
jgi:long-chain acyl-CoA synthetase